MQHKPSTPSIEFVTQKQLAERLGVSILTVHRWAKDGTLPRPLRFGRRCIRWRVAELEQFFDNHQSQQRGVPDHDQVQHA